jgi:DNA-binding transcriptional MerR regulator
MFVTQNIGDEIKLTDSKKSNIMETIYLNSILILLIGLIVGSKVSSLRVAILRGFTRYKKISTTQGFSNKAALTSFDIKKGNRYFDDLEIRLLLAITELNTNGLDIPSLNSLLNLNKFSEENQRQRRHLFLKELNLKLFLIFGIREGINRVEFDNDKRMKKYILDVKIDLMTLKNLIASS